MTDKANPSSVHQNFGEWRQIKSLEGNTKDG
jgi:hypothetical protein